MFVISSRGLRLSRCVQSTSWLCAARSISLRHSSSSHPSIFDDLRQDLQKRTPPDIPFPPTSAEPQQFSQHVSADLHHLHQSLRHELTSRKLPLIFDDLNPTPSHLLNVALLDFLPRSCFPSDFDPFRLPESRIETGNELILPVGHHLVYFNPQIPASLLLPDGTDPLQSPGEPFVRRMWAGGSLTINRKPPRLTGKRMVCVETIPDIVVKGTDGDEKVFVTIERRIHNLPSGTRQSQVERVGFGDEQPAVVEKRDIVFMPAKSDEVARADSQKVQKVLKRTYLFFITLTWTVV